MSLQEDKEPTSEIHRRRGRTRSGPRLGRKSVRALSAIILLIVIIVVVLILIDHVTPMDGPHIMP